ncbi:MAG: hypothetical protein OHK0017_06400 [Patescibacteria group bacterium]
MLGSKLKLKFQESKLQVNKEESAELCNLPEVKLNYKLTQAYKLTGQVLLQLSLSKSVKYLKTQKPLLYQTIISDFIERKDLYGSIMSGNVLQFLDTIKINYTSQNFSSKELSLPAAIQLPLFMSYVDCFANPDDGLYQMTLDLENVKQLEALLDFITEYLIHALLPFLNNQINSDQFENLVVNKSIPNFDQIY